MTAKSYAAFKYRTSSDDISVFPQSGASRLSISYEEIVDHNYNSESEDDDGITYIAFDADYSKEKEKESSEPTKAE